MAFKRTKNPLLDQVRKELAEREHTKVKSIEPEKQISDMEKSVSLTSVTSECIENDYKLKYLKTNQKLERYQSINLTAKEYEEAMSLAVNVTVRDGKDITSYTIAPFESGYADIGIGDNGIPVGRWISDGFSIESVCKDDIGKIYVNIVKNGKAIRIPIQSFQPGGIPGLLQYDIASDFEPVSIKALAKYFQIVLNRYPIIPANETIGYLKNGDQLNFTGYKGEPSPLKYNLSFGSVDEYISELNRLTGNSVPNQLVMSAACAAPLLAFYSLRDGFPCHSFAISVVGRSSTGKSTALKLAASMFSAIDDKRLFTSFYGTNNALIKLLNNKVGVPMCYDESTVTNNFNRADFIYTIGEEMEKQRLNASCTFRQSGMWKTIVFLCSEKHLIDMNENQNLGLAIRLHTYDDLQFTGSHTEAEEIQQLVFNNYGIIGKMITEKIEAEPDKIFSCIKESREEMLEILNKNKCSLTERISNEYALILTAAKLLHEMGVSIDISGIVNLMADNHKSISDRSDLAKNAVTAIADALAKNPYMSGVKWDENNNRVIIVESTTLDILKKAGFQDTKQAIKQLDEGGFIIRQQKGRIKSKLYVDKISCYTYQFKLDKLSALNDENTEIHKISVKELISEDVEEVVYYADEESDNTEGLTEIA